MAILPSETADRTGALAPPPLIYAGFILLGWLAERFWPLATSLPTTAAMAGWSLLVLAGGLALWSVLAFRRARTTVNPFGGTTRIVVKGPFAFSRNPMYVAMTAAHLGLALVLGSAWMMVTLPPALLLIRYGVIAREEAYLARKFGEPYVQYLSRVRRWL